MDKEPPGASPVVAAPVMDVKHPPGASPVVAAPIMGRGLDKMPGADPNKERWVVRVCVSAEANGSSRAKDRKIVVTWRDGDHWARTMPKDKAKVKAEAQATSQI